MFTPFVTDFLCVESPTFRQKRSNINKINCFKMDQKFLNVKQKYLMFIFAVIYYSKAKNNHFTCIKNAGNYFSKDSI